MHSDTQKITELSTGEPTQKLFVRGHKYVSMAHLVLHRAHYSSHTPLIPRSQFRTLSATSLHRKASSSRDGFLSINWYSMRVGEGKFSS